MRGIGIQPAGTTSAGFGAPEISEEDESVILENTATRESFGSRKLDPKTRDYVMSEYGRIEGMNNVQQLVQIAIANAAPQLREILTLGEGFARDMLAILTSATADLVAQGFIDVLGVTTRMNEEGGLQGGQAVTVFRWRDRTTGEEQESPV